MQELEQHSNVKWSWLNGDDLFGLCFQIDETSCVYNGAALSKVLQYVTQRTKQKALQDLNIYHYEVSSRGTYEPRVEIQSESCHGLGK